MAVGNHTLVDALFRFKSNIDSGIPQAIQEAAIEALLGPQEDVAIRSRILQARRDKIVDALQQIGLKVQKPKAAFYIWARVPDGYTSVEYVAELLDKAGMAVTPGTGYGREGEGYIRLSITQPDARFNEGVKRLLSMKKQ